MEYQDRWENSTGKLEIVAIEEDTETYITQMFLTQMDDQVKQAKLKELTTWKEKEVFEEVVYKGQKLMTLRWVTNLKKEGKCLLKKMCERVLKKFF